MARSSAPWMLASAMVALGPLVRHPVQAQGFGSAVAASQRELFIGNPSTPYAPGTVHIYASGGQGSGWREVARLNAADGVPLDRFGRSIALDRDRALIGASSADSGRGAAYLFERDAGGVWKQVAKLAAPDARPGDGFGRVVALSGETAYVASWGQSEARGAVAVWRQRERAGAGAGAGQWTLETTLGASDALPGSGFGTALALDGGRLLVGAAQRDSAAGAAYLFHRDPATGTWVEEAKLTGAGLTRNAGFGAAVALRGDTALVGAPGLERGSGAVSVFVRDPEGGGWAERSRLRPFDGGPGVQFGAALGLIAPDELWIGAPGADGRQGRIYRLTRAPTGSLTAAIKLGAEDLERGDGFGGAFALAGAHAVVGLPGDDFGAGTAVILARAGDGGWTPAGKVWSEDKGLDPIAGAKVSCAGGKARLFDCGNVDLLAFLPVSALGGGRGVRVNDIWGWTDPESGREYAVVGRVDGTAFVDVSDPTHPAYLGDLPKSAGAQASVWRDIKVYRNHAFIVADGALSHGMQVFDLTRLRRPGGGGGGGPVRFTEDARYDRIHSAHNIVVDTATGYAFIVGASAGGETCGGGLHMVDIRDPKHPAFAGCFADPATGRAGTGYTHDAQCVVYHGPDEAYRGRELCFNASETALGIADVTDKTQPKAVARAAYPNVAYTHQGWLTEDQRFFLMDDELDELAGTVAGTRTLIFDVSDLDDPVLAGEYISANRATDHNLYVQGRLMYQSNYVSGLRVFDVSDPTHPSPAGFFDTVPVGEDAPGFGGSWSNYPFFKSGTLVVTSMSEGLFILKRADPTLIP